MTEKYWQRYKKQMMAEMWYNNKLWVEVRKDLERGKKPKHPLELYNMCKSENPYIRQIRRSPNITVDTVAELICRDVACDLQYCLLLQSRESAKARNKLK